MIAFSSYGAFWMSYAVILIPGSGIIQAYETQAEFHNAVGMYLMVWFMVTVMFMYALVRTCVWEYFLMTTTCSAPVVRRNIAFTTLLSFLALAFLMLSISEFTGNVK